MSKQIDPRVRKRMDDPTAPKLKSNWMMSLPVIAKPKTWVYAILTDDDRHDRLGRIQWYGRSYIFVPNNDPNYEDHFYASCLYAIADFCKALMQERKNQRLVRKEEK